MTLPGNPALFSPVHALNMYTLDWKRNNQKNRVMFSQTCFLLQWIAHGYPKKEQTKTLTESMSILHHFSCMVPVFQSCSKTMSHADLYIFRIYWWLFYIFGIIIWWEITILRVDIQNYLILNYQTNKVHLGNKKHCLMVQYFWSLKRNWCV